SANCASITASSASTALAINCCAPVRSSSWSGSVASTGSGNTCRVDLVMAYHLSVVEILDEINQQDTPPSSVPHTPQMTITHKSGVKGVSWSKCASKWQAIISVNGVKKYLGVFEDVKSAELVIRKERERLHGEFSRHK